ncbi:endolytic transglycosylase MltG [Tepidamorphus sp. 3E244]|uniref:endolytic transglycosylase MltG n=1 Tax=Tepidamorphus sp. 3E244 TaxID=3385498 RepID=UPI0038FC7C14
MSENDNPRDETSTEHEEPAPMPTRSRRVKPPKAKRKARRNPFIVLMSGFFSLLFLGVIVGGATLYLGKIWFDREGPLTEAKTVVIQRGRGVQQIAQQLKHEGVIDKGGFIDDGLIFAGGVFLHKAQGELKAGEYAFEPGASMYDVMEKLRSGKSILHGLTVAEGLTSKQIVALVNSHDMLSGDEVQEIPDEGMLLPETYKFTRGTPRAQIVRQMRADLDKALADAWENRDPELPLNSPEEMLTLASIVEKETAVAAERPQVASVFVNRLRKGMKLQSDPTIIYGLYGGDAWGVSRTITRSELNAPNPYSTYQIDRLPPGPIANVGVDALKAVSQPAETDYLYFVADGTGGHAFAKTLDEHNRNVAKWREIEKTRGQQQGASAADGATTQ